MTDVDINGAVVRGEYNPNTCLKDIDVIEIRHRLHILHQTSREVYLDYEHLVSYDSF